MTRGVREDIRLAESTIQNGYRVSVFDGKRASKIGWPHLNGHASPKRHSVVSLFSGCGGLDLGFEGGFSYLGEPYTRLPFDIVWANDINPAACDTYQMNLRGDIHCDDIWDSIPTLPEAVDVVVGGFPCQDISMNGLKRGIAGERSGLYRAMVHVNHKN